MQFDFNAEGGTRTRTTLVTTPSRWRVYQFHHFRKIIFMKKGSANYLVKIIALHLEASVESRLVVEPGVEPQALWQARWLQGLFLVLPVSGLLRP